MQYAKVFAMGVLKSPREEDMRLFASLISATLDVENAIHKSYLKKLGLSNEELAAAKPSIVTDSYTNYMIAVAQKEGMAEIMAAVLACSWTYKLIGDYLENYPGAKDQEFYGDWVRQYMSESYRGANDLMIDMFDRFSEGCTEEDLLAVFEDPEAVSDALFYSFYYYSMTVLSQIPDILDKYGKFSKESKNLREEFTKH